MTAKKRTTGTMNRGLEVTGAVYGAAEALNRELKENLENSLSNVSLLTLIMFYERVKRVWKEDLL